MMVIVKSITKVKQLMIPRTKAEVLERWISPLQDFVSHNSPCKEVCSDSSSLMVSKGSDEGKYL